MPVSTIAASTAAVIFLGGTGSGYLPQGTPETLDNFARPFVTAPYDIQDNQYNGAPWVKPQASAGQINAAIKALQEANPEATTTVIGLSKGAQVATAQSHLDDAPVNVRYVLIANPDRQGGGFSVAIGWTPKYGEVTHNVNEVYAQYDGFADWPDLFNPLAVANAIAGIVYVHPFYGNGTAADPLTRIDQAEVTVTDNLDADGNPNGTTTTQTRIPTPNLPLTQVLRDLGVHKDFVDGLDNVLRPVIDLGYKRTWQPPAANSTREASRQDQKTVTLDVTPVTETKDDKVEDKATEIVVTRNDEQSESTDNDTTTEAAASTTDTGAGDE